MNIPARILAAVDFSDRSRVALGFAARLACQFRAELHVMHAQDPLLAAAAQTRGIDVVREAEDELRAAVAATWPAPQCGLHFDVIVGPPAAAITQAAERERADVIVMAAHGMTGVQQALLGSTTEGVLRRSNVSVLVVPDDWEPADPAAIDLRGEGPVIVGVDFRIPSIEAAADGATLARMLRTELVLVHVIRAVRVLPRWREHAEAAVAERAVDAQQQLDRIRHAVDGDVPTHTIVTRGRVPSCLVEAARRYPHGIMAVGRSAQSHAYAPPGRTAYRVLTQARLPVLTHVVR